MPISIIAKTVPAIIIVCGFLLMFYYGGAYANNPDMVETGKWMVIGGAVLQVLWLFLFRRRR
jgi:heme/copper-type cytochrome/quinol oxidase subunit 2